MAETAQEASAFFLNLKFLSKVNYFLCASFAAFISSVLCTLLRSRPEHENAIGENEGLCHENAEVPLNNSVPHTTRNNRDFLVRP